ncbi:L,D-transpeptidase YcbB [Roseibacterium elongatum DSM 19469]|uniref:L,D-transpeptidase YcbB n=1 Tax=Roseicyclus elongatus DSM 19469 TaxID=1294273 RepID=W8S4Y3_9RHOB|nr:L,D-transpeptidase family protein [Roseibacterium elongatum]AHM05282.1 L,D-transpeptidase YcbB [Roseibacterium elongatum DSM 19469]
MTLKFTKTPLFALALAALPFAAPVATGVGVGIGLTLAPAPVQAQAFSALRQAIAEASSENESLAAFYRERDFQPVWTSAEAADRRNALISALQEAGNHGLPTSRYDIDGLIETFRNATNPYARGQADVMASRLFLQYASDVHSGFLEPGDIISDFYQELPRPDARELLADLLDSNPHAFMASLPPQDPGYTRLMRTKLHLERLAQTGGYGPRVQAGALRPGDSGGAVIALRDRLMAMGYLDRSVTATYDARMQQAVVEFQLDNGINADGVAGGETIRAVNRSVEDHWNEVVLAMERHRWLNEGGEVPDRLIFVNLTDFHVRVIDNGETTFITRSVVGARDRQTPEFSDVMEHMVINPSWYVPRSIAMRSYIPNILAGGSTYMQLIANGRVVNRNAVDMSRYSVSSFPFDLRQPPGPRNALGTVKFMFPNRHAIYLHDTPEQYLMEREVRTFSSGCIRLDDPHEFAYHLLARQTDDPVGLFQRILRTGQETQVNLDVEIPVHLVYWTAWVDDDGTLNFRDDVYGRNARLSQAVRANGVVMPERAS